MKKLNIVYAYMCEPRFEIAIPGRDAIAVWTTVEESDADVIVYHSGYSYDARRAAANPSACRILYTYEPLTVFPAHFLRRFWESFDYVMTWCKTLLEQGGPFVQFPSLYYDFPFGSAHGVASDPICPPDWQEKRKTVCQVAGNKYSLIRSELYSRRRKIARWFGSHGLLSLDTYGVPAMPVPGYCGRAADKLETMSQYRFSLCLENDAHPLWSRGYVTEKIFDCFYAFTVPIYLGAADIEDHIPKECFVDLRDFQSLNDLDRFLADMPDEQYYGYLVAIEHFLKEYDAPSKHSCFQMYEKALHLLETKPTSKPNQDLFGFWQKASSMEKVSFLLMDRTLPIYQKIRSARYAGEE